MPWATLGKEGRGGWIVAFKRKVVVKRRSPFGAADCLGEMIRGVVGKTTPALPAQSTTLL